MEAGLTCIFSYLVGALVFLLVWRITHYRTPYQEARDIEEEAAYWREQQRIKNEKNNNDT